MNEAGVTIEAWHWSLEAGATEYARLEESLDPYERGRAAAMASELLRQRYVVAHGVARAILGRYTDVPAAAVECRVGEHGKPEIIQPKARQPLHFSLSHSKGMALLAVGHGVEVGADLELPGKRQDFRRVARRFFAAREAEHIAASGEESEFLRYWTAKEAYVKYLGRGLHIPLDSFEARFGERDDFAIKDSEGENLAYGQSFEPVPGSIAAVVTGSGGRSLHVREFLADSSA